MDKYDALKIDNQLCFPLYAASREIIKKYRPFLEEIGLTYTQYITMMVVWENKSVSVKELGDNLDSGTLTPVLKSLEAKGCIMRKRKSDDERVLTVSVTDEGERLREKAVQIPTRISSCVPLTPDEASTLYSLLYKLLRD